MSAPPALPDPATALLLGVPFHDVTMAETLDRVDTLIARRAPRYLATANLDFAARASRDVELQRILLEAELVLCDGTPLVWASRWMGAPLRERVAGSDLLPRLFARAAEKGHKVFLLGASDEVLRLTEEKCAAAHPGWRIAGGYAPPHARLLEIDHEEVVSRIRAVEPDLLLVAMGCPKQEKWIFMHYRALGVPVSIGIGASLDFLAGKFRRAPVWMRRGGAEWIFRLLQEPRRLTGRYARDLLFFLRALRRQKLLLRASGGSPGQATEGMAAGRRRVRWSGRLDRTMPTIVPRAGEMVLIECSGVTGFDAFGLGQLAQCWRRIHRAGGTLALLRPSPALAQALTLTGLDRQFIVAADESALSEEAPATTIGSPAASTLTLELSGELTAATVREQEKLLTAAWQEAPQARELQLALGKLRFMDSSGLGLLVKVLKLTRQRPQGRLALLDPPENIRNVIQLANLGPVLGVAGGR